ncbi:methionine aminopeptidase [Guyanagaster necrorhizus]|uniref:Methionine aminopeptidase n=1 Tax=Guyanagaster necrorhizus TaxID=856835 RepID=A0A9P8AU85_9AGAR|nr:methionine aminopeptidase [Guyanagaster necrorhizus MCA 3950]KAG7447771.1 methionine aminopeptidase [Guyanagaster necrorhizus MCA 3950]
MFRRSCSAFGRTLTTRPFRHVCPTPRLFSHAADGEEVCDFGTYSVILPEEPFVFGVSHIAPRPVPPSIRVPPYIGSSGHDVAPTGDSIIELGGEEEARVRRAGALASRVRDFAGSLVKVGVTTNAIDAAVHEYIVARGAYPSPLRYKGFPKSCCTRYLPCSIDHIVLIFDSINNVIAHGIPDDRPLEDGDIINIDITIFLDGYHGDTSETFLVGDVDPEGRVLCAVTSNALKAGIAACGPGKPFKAIGQAIHHYLADNRSQLGMDFCVSQQFTGHGIGTAFHAKPWILHSYNEEPGIMKPGHCFTIEPSIIQGKDPKGWVFPDGWTTSTKNCARSAQAEHMILVTGSGADILTL